MQPSNPINLKLNIANPSVRILLSLIDSTLQETVRNVWIGLIGGAP
ncbi:predicted protein [Plenodomus lingam JN3]|uniref:Predicted protein n=1 Tax=Leptosphaeria maculans (strain JN3 / isolate v23.1.3 / race Av1-4-5-6-7-8) TaxID=985895 RepID=E4ZJI4_LEPMJ|nr:predicted protein [Plenodomus lingam JN3]CBX91775.1 predicted protein [Plenodomus lingam JN3]